MNNVGSFTRSSIRFFYKSLYNWNFVEICLVELRIHTKKRVEIDINYLNFYLHSDLPKYTAIVLCNLYKLPFDCGWNGVVLYFVILNNLHTSAVIANGYIFYP